MSAVERTSTRRWSSAYRDHGRGGHRIDDCTERAALDRDRGSDSTSARSSSTLVRRGSARRWPATQAICRSARPVDQAGVDVVQEAADFTVRDQRVERTAGRPPGGRRAGPRRRGSDCQEASWPADAPTCCAQLLLGVRGHRAAGVRDDQDPLARRAGARRAPAPRVPAGSPGRPGCGRSWRRRAGGRASAAGRSGSPCRSRSRRPACATPSKPPRSKSAANSRFAAIRSSKSPTGRTLAERRCGCRAGAQRAARTVRRVRVSRRVLLASGGAVVVGWRAAAPWSSTTCCPAAPAPTTCSG